MWGLNPFGYHLENLLIHGLNCGLVYFFLIKCLQVGMSPMKRSSTFEVLENIAFRASLLFAVHPIHVEPVGGVVGRADVSATGLFHSYLKKTNTNTYISLWFPLISSCSLH